MKMFNSNELANHPENIKRKLSPLAMRNKLVKKFHPDINKGDNSNDLTAEINEAYKEYEKTGNSGKLESLYEQGIENSDSPDVNKIFNHKRGLKQYNQEKNSKDNKIDVAV